MQSRLGALVLGTVHIGSESANKAAILLRAFRPRTVVVGIAPARLTLICRRIKRKEEDSNKEQATNGSPPIHNVPLQKK